MVKFISAYREGLQEVLRGSGIRDFAGKKRAKFGILIMNGARDLGILRSGKREISL